MRGQIRKRGKNWAVIVYLGRDSATGKKLRKWYTHRTLREAQAHLAHLLVHVQAGGGVARGRGSVGDFLDQWLRDDVARLGPKTRHTYAYDVRHYLIPALGIIPL